MKNILPLLLPVLLILPAGCRQNLTNQSEAAPPADDRRPNILFLIADDWSYPHAGAYGDPVVRTPVFDRLAAGGGLFTNAYCAAPSCSPSRAAILTGRYPHQLESAGNLWSVFPDKFPNWVSLLAGAGYFTGMERKGWGPGDHVRGGYPDNPAGKSYRDFGEFLAARPAGQPFCYWFGSNDPHRDYEPNTGVSSGMDPALVEVPGFLPDLPCVRNDLLDYYYEVERFDRQCGNILKAVEAAGELGNTLVIMTSDNGMPFPRAKANMYDYGTRMPFVVNWPGRISSQHSSQAFINFVDIGPTLLEAAGLAVPAEMSGRSFLPLLRGEPDDATRDRVYLERERHANVRAGDGSYPVRAVRTADYLYLRNFEPDRWPAGDPQTHQSVGQYGDVDNSITKFLMLDMEHSADSAAFFAPAFAKRPPEELYVLADDPYNLHDVAGDPAYADILAGLRADLRRWMEATADPRATDPQTIYWDTVEYTPDYQFYDFNLQEEIDQYRMLRPAGEARMEEVGCR